MARNLIASKLITSVRNRAMIPDDIDVYNDEAILEILNEEMDVGLLDTLMTIHEEHIVTHTDVPLTGERRYPIPTRAVGNKLREASYVNGSNVYELARVDLGELSDYRYDDGYTGIGTDIFYVEGNEICIINPRFRDAAYIRMYFHLRPNYIVLESKCGKISSIDKVTGVIQFNEIPKEFINLTTIDFVQNSTPNKILAFDVPIVSVSISMRSITVDPTLLPKNLTVGDWICFPEETPYPNVPTELHPVLAQRAAVFILEALGDSQNLQLARAKLAQMEKSVMKLMDDRVEGAPRKVKNRYGTLSYKIGYNRGRTSRGKL